MGLYFEASVVSKGSHILVVYSTGALIFLCSDYLYAYGVNTCSFPCTGAMTEYTPAPADCSSYGVI